MRTEFREKRREFASPWYKSVLMTFGLPRATIDRECEYVRYKIRDRGVKKLLKTTDQVVSKVYSDIARCVTEE